MCPVNDQSSWLFLSLWLGSAHWRRLGVRFEGDGIGALTPKFFCRPPMRNLGGRQKTHCLFEVLALAQYYCPQTLRIVPYILPFNAWFRPVFGGFRYLAVGSGEISKSTTEISKSKYELRRNSKSSLTIGMDFVYRNWTWFRREFHYLTGGFRYFSAPFFGYLPVTASPTRPGQSFVSLQMTAVILALQIAV